VTVGRRAQSSARLVEAALSLLCVEGVGGVSVQRVADAAGVSKGLVHYHFRDKDALLCACAEALVTDLIARDEVARRARTAATALESLWEAVASSLVDGRRRAFLALCAESPTGVREVLAALARDRQAAAGAVIATLEDVFGWSPRVPRATLAAAYVALVDGLALDAAIRPTADQRRAFDAFWFVVLAEGD
jgi:TetR/AcrR family transcriptional regulator, transcriptional repressor of bet genes